MEEKLWTVDEVQRPCLSCFSNFSSHLWIFFFNFLLSRDWVLRYVKFCCLLHLEVNTYWNLMRFPSIRIVAFNSIHQQRHVSPSDLFISRETRWSSQCTAVIDYSNVNCNARSPKKATPTRCTARFQCYELFIAFFFNFFSLPIA